MAAEQQENRVLSDPATVEACAEDYADRDQTGEARTQHGEVYASAQTGIPRTTS